MAVHFHSNQFQDAFYRAINPHFVGMKKYSRIPEKAKERPSRILCDDRGHLLPGVLKSKHSAPFGDFIGTWDPPQPPNQPKVHLIVKREVKAVRDHFLESKEPCNQEAYLKKIRAEDDMALKKKCPPTTICITDDIPNRPLDKNNKFNSTQQSDNESNGNNNNQTVIHWPRFPDKKGYNSIKPSVENWNHRTLPDAAVHETKTGLLLEREIASRAPVSSALAWMSFKSPGPTHCAKRTVMRFPRRRNSAENISVSKTPPPLHRTKSAIGIPSTYRPQTPNEVNGNETPPKINSSRHSSGRSNKSSVSVPSVKATKGSESQSPVQTTMKSPDAEQKELSAVPDDLKSRSSKVDSPIPSERMSSAKKSDSHETIREPLENDKFKDDIQKEEISSEIKEKESNKEKKSTIRPQSHRTISSATTIQSILRHSPTPVIKTRPKTSRAPPKEVQTQTDDSSPITKQRTIGIQVLRRHCDACSTRRPLTAPVRHPKPPVRIRPPLRPPWLTESWVGLPVSSQGPYPTKLRFVSLYNLAYGSKKNLKDMLA